MFKNQVAKNFIAFILLLGVTMSAIPASATTTGETKAFSDVKDGHWAKNSIDYVSSLGLINGYGDGKFGPDDTVTIEQFIVMLVRTIGVKIEGNYNFYRYYEEALRNGIIKNNEFNDCKAPITREVMTKLAIRAYFKLNKDVTYPDYLYAFEGAVSDFKAITAGETSDSVLKAMEQGIIAGCSDGRFQPFGTSTRAQAAAVIHRILDQKERDKVKPIFADPDPEFEKLMKEDLHYDYVSKTVQSVKDGVVLWTDFSGIYGNYGISILPYYHNREINKEAYEMLKTMTYSAIENGNYIDAYYLDNGSKRTGIFKYYIGAISPAYDNAGKMSVNFEIDPFDRNETLSYIGFKQKENTYYTWGIHSLHGNNIIPSYENKWQEDRYKKVINNMLKVIYGEKMGQDLYEYYLKEYVKIRAYATESIKPQEGDKVLVKNGMVDYWNIESYYHPVYKNLEIQNLIHPGSFYTFGTNKVN